MVRTGAKVFTIDREEVGKITTNYTKYNRSMQIKIHRMHQNLLNPFVLYATIKIKKIGRFLKKELLK